MKTKHYKDLASNLKRLVLLKYFQDPIGSLIKIRYQQRNEEHQAIEISTGEGNYLVLVEPRMLSSMNWDAQSIDDEDDDFGMDSDLDGTDFYEDFSDDAGDNFYA
ncbi:MAG: hypothetical protein ABJG68_15200 [Crocinitomicaceae bacterium]